MDEPSFTIGIEEEYLLVDLDTRDLAANPPAAFMKDCEERLGSRVSPEFLRCQVEIGTPVCNTIEDARQSLADLRGTIAEVAKSYGMAPLAVSTHPFADWERLMHTDKERYNELAEDLQVVVRRLVICGMHTHVCIEDERLRNDIFNQIPYFLPHILALSTSSPFWRGQKTGLKSYRLSIFNEMPRTGLPEQFASEEEYRRTVQVLVDAGLIEDASKIWWDLRPSSRFPTLEQRVTDVCPRMEDTLSLAALFRCLARHLWRLRTQNQRWRQYSRFLVEENRWLGQRHGVGGKMVDFGRGECVAFPDLVEEIIQLIEPDAEHFGCVAAIEHLRAIANEGTSADRQLALYDSEIKNGSPSHQALKSVVDMLIDETVAGT